MNANTNKTIRKAAKYAATTGTALLSVFYAVAAVWIVIRFSQDGAAAIGLAAICFIGFVAFAYLAKDIRNNWFNN